jgi:putative membrane protein insertion efficiency factor
MRRIVALVSRAVCGVLILFVRAYQVTLSPHIGSCCRFEPTCSAYCIEALKTHGAWRGGWLTLRRILRCRPFGPSGYDPVPPRKGC